MNSWAIAHNINFKYLVYNCIFSERYHRHQCFFAERVALVEYEIADAVIDSLAVDGVDVLNDMGMVSNY